MADEKQSKQNKPISIPDLIKEVEPGFGIEGPLGGQYLHFNGDWIWTNNGEVGCVVFCPDSIPEMYGSVDGKRLSHFISRAPNPDKIVFRMHEKNDAKWLMVKSGRAQIDLKWIEEDMAKMPGSPGRWKKVPKDFGSMLGFVAHCCASHITRPWLTCVHVFNDFIESSDGMRVIRQELEEPLKSVDTLVPRNIAYLLAKTGVSRIAPKDDMVWFKTPKDTLIFCPLVAGEYPDVNHIIESSGKSTKFTLPFEIASKNGDIKLEDALDRAKVFEGEEEELKIILEVEDGNMKIEAEDGVGKYRESIRLKKAPKDLSVRVQMNAQHLLDLVKHQQSVDCELTDDRMWMKTDDWVLVSVVEANGE